MSTANATPASAQSANDEADVLFVHPSDLLDSPVLDASESSAELTPETLRIVNGTVIGGLTGASLGILSGSRSASLRFRAENAHRLPSSQKGWFMYHKAKNYYVLQASFREGGLKALKIGGVVGAFLMVEEAVARYRESVAPIVTLGYNDTLASGGGDKGWLVGRDFLNTTLAGTSVSGAYALKNRMPMNISASLIRKGLWGGLVFGLCQDGLRVTQGYRLPWMEKVKSGLGVGDTRDAPP